MSEVKTSFATIEDFKFVKEIMLLALRSDTLAFSVNYEEYAFNSDAWWENYLNPFLYQINSKLLLAKLDNKVVGMIGMIYESRPRRVHISTLVWFFVDTNNRGMGIGNTLISEIIKQIQTRKEVKKISLIMNSPQEDAYKIYIKNGFKKVGTLENELKINNEFYNEYILEKMI